MEPSSTTSRNPAASSASAPGLGIRVATPLVQSSAGDSQDKPPTSSAVEDKNRTGRHDYFSVATNDRSGSTPEPPPKTPASTTEEHTHHASPEPEKEAKRGGSLFGKKFQMTFPKKLGRTSTETKPVVEEKAEESDKESSVKEKVYDEHFWGVVEKIQDQYEEFSAAHPGQVVHSAIAPCTEDEIPVLNLPPQVSIIIQDDPATSAVAADLYRGTIGTVSEDTDQLEKTAPAWLAEFLLLVRFVLIPSVNGRFLFPNLRLALEHCLYQTRYKSRI